MQTNMADSQESGLIQEESGNHAVSGTAVVVSAPCITEGESETVGEDILQQALVEAEEFDQESVGYAVHADDVSGAVSVAQEIDNSEITDSGLDSAAQMVSSEDRFGTTTYTVVGTLPDGTISLPDELIAHAAVTETDEQGVEMTEGSVLDSDGHLVSSLPLEQHHLHETDQNGVQQVEADQEAVPQEVPQEVEAHQEPQTVRFALVSGNNNSGAPLGSSQNPIRIIQQGNQYTPVQQLTPEQLQQIMQVVQQQQLARNTQESGGSVLFNPATNTRIVYRVIYPAELHKGQQILQMTPTTTTVQSPSVQTPKRQYRKRGKEDEEDKVDGPEMSKEEKEERKKHRPRTRSGRVSKPPKHMVKDYKHIHVLDWDEDYDDSDGGYSDYKGSDEEGKSGKQNSSPDGPDSQLFSGLGSTRPKNFKCQTCEKSYIGSAGLGRHYRLNPSHGSLPDASASIKDDAGEDSNSKPESALTANSATSSSLVTGTPDGGAVAVAGSVGSSTGNLSEDSNTQDSIPSSSGAMSPVSANYTPRSHRGRGRSRGRWAYRHHTAPMKRKQKLRDLIKTCEDEDLMEVVLPRLAKVITLWEFMLMKIESSSTSHPRVDHVYQQFAALHKQVKRVCQESLMPVRVKTENSNSTEQKNGMDGEESQDGSITTLKLDDAAIAQSLGFKPGTYAVKDVPMDDHSSFRYKLLTSDPNGPAGTPAPGEKRTIQVVTPDELVAQPASKRQRVTSLLNPAGLAASSGMAPASAAASSLLSSIVTNSRLKGAGEGQASTQSVFRTVSIQEPQTTALRTVAVQQPHSSLLRTVAVQQPHNSGSQTYILGSPMSAKQQKGVIGVSLLGSSSSVAGVMATSSQPSGQQQVTVVRANPLSSAQVVGASSAPIVSVIPSCQAATSTPLSFIQPSSVTSVVNTIAPVDFMDTSGDSLISSTSGLSSANNSGIVSVTLNSTSNGDVTDTSFAAKINGISDSKGLDSEELSEKAVPSSDSGTMFVTSAAGSHSSTLPASSLPSAINSSAGTTSFIIKCENGEVYQVMGSEAGQSSVSTSQVVGTSLATNASNSNTSGSKTTAALNGLMNGTDGADTTKQDLTDSLQGVVLDGAASDSNTEAAVISDQLVADEGEGQVMTGETAEQGEGQISEEQQHASIFQMEDGIFIIQNPDGTTFQLQGAQGIPLETVQALLAMEGHIEPGDQIQTEIQQ